MDIKLFWIILLIGFRGRNGEVNTDDCLHNRCSNGSTCVEAINGYECVCPNSYTGQYCDEDIDECALNPRMCLNGGICMNSPGTYMCVCDNGWAGDDCGHNEDDCHNNPCYNGGTCRDLVAYFECECPIGTTGSRCHLDDACLSSPCPSGASCETSPDGEAICDCKKGWSGPDCSLDVDECTETENSPCENGGTCINSNGSFHCQCKMGFSGSFCENINECNSTPCQKNGTCLDETGKYSCLHTPDWADAKIVDGKCFLFVHAYHNWDDALTTCANIGGVLATVTSLEQLEWIKTSLSLPDESYWTGANKKTTGVYVWVENEIPATELSSMWSDGNPSSISGYDCVYISSLGKAKNFGCTYNTSFLCMEPNSATTKCAAPTTETEATSTPSPTTEVTTAAATSTTTTAPPILVTTKRPLSNLIKSKKPRNPCKKRLKKGRNSKGRAGHRRF